MKLNRKELRKIQYEFNSISNRLLQADFDDYAGVLKKFLTYLRSTPIVAEYIDQFGECDFDVQSEVQSVMNSYGHLIFVTGESEQEEVRNIFAVLKYIVENNIKIHYGIAVGYSESNRFQDKIKGFNDRFVMVLISYIESYLTKLGIDMGMDERTVYNVTVHGGQAIIAAEGATVTATNTIGLSNGDFDKLLESVRLTSQALTPEKKEEVAESLEVIETEAKSEKPKKSMLNTALKTLKGIAGAAEFMTAVGQLAEFLGLLV